MKRCETCHRPIKRSSEFNRLYWLLLHMIADKVKPEGQQYAAKTWHRYFKRRYLGAQDERLPNGEVESVVNSTAELDTAEFMDYFTNVQMWAQQRNIYLEDVQPA